MQNMTMRDAFFNSLYKLASKDRNIIVVSADMGAPALDIFRKNLKSQFINVGIAEANMVTIAAGLALSGKKVFIYAIMPFVTSRCYEMIKVDLSLMNLAVTAVGVGAGFSYDDSGPTHHSTEDIGIMRALPNMTVLSPSDALMAGRFADISCSINGPSYIRLDREMQPLIYSRKEDFSEGLSLLKKGPDLCLIATGNMVHHALKVSSGLGKKRIKAGVIDLYRIKPVNEKLLLKYLKGYRKAVTIEEHLLQGGMGSLVAEIIADNNLDLRLKRFGIKDKYYYAYGGRENIQSLCHLDVGNITKNIFDWVK